MRTATVCGFIVLGLAACNPDDAVSSRESVVQETVKEMLVDPGSAQFGTMADFTTTGGTKRVCIEYNAKNQLGGYTGTGTAILDDREDGTFQFVRSIPGASCDHHLSKK